MPAVTVDEKANTEIITLPVAGSIPGIPGHHGPGTYIVDWDRRTIAPITETKAEPSLAKKAAKAPTTSEQPE